MFGKNAGKRLAERGTDVSRSWLLVGSAECPYPLTIPAKNQELKTKNGSLLP